MDVITEPEHLLPKAHQERWLKVVWGCALLTLSYLLLSWSQGVPLVFSFSRLTRVPIPAAPLSIVYCLGLWCLYRRYTLVPYPQLVLGINTLGKLVVRLTAWWTDPENFAPTSALEWLFLMTLAANILAALLLWKHRHEFGPDAAEVP